MLQRTLLPALLISGALLLGSSVSSSGEPSGECQAAQPRGEHPPGQIAMRMRPGPPDGEFLGAGPPPPFLLGLNLAEAQQDKIFDIVHAAAPALRNQWKALHKARQSLRELAHSAQFDAARASALAQSVGDAQRQLELLQVRVDHDVFATLSSEQQSKVRERERDLEKGFRPGWGAPGEMPGPGSPPPHE